MRETAERFHPSRLGDPGPRMSSASLFWGLLFGSLGAGYFVYGKKQGAIVPLLCGIALCVFPYFVTNTVLLVVIGTALAAIPYFVRL